MTRALVLCLAVLAVAVACAPPPSAPDRPPINATEVAYTGQHELIAIVIDSVTPRRSGESGPNEETELRLLVIGADAQDHGSGMFCPGAEPIKMSVGQTVASPCGLILAFDPAVAGEQFLLLIAAVDEDEIDFIGDLGAELGIAALSRWLIGAAKGVAHVGSAAGGPLVVVGEVALEAGISYVGGEAVDYFEREDILGQQAFVLHAARDWGAGHQLSFTTQDGGLDVTFHVVRVSTAGSAAAVAPLPSDGGQAVVQPVNLPAPAATPPPTAVPPTAMPRPDDRLAELILFAPGSGDIGPLRDGDTVDLGRLGSYLDVRAETNGAVGSVYFTLDDAFFDLNGRDVENAAPFYMGGDKDGVPYGNWDWSSLAGGEHTIAAYACAGSYRQGGCGAPLVVRVRVQW